MIPSENFEAECLANRLKANNYIFTHIANESGLPPKVAMLSAMRKKRMWLAKWVSDFFIFLKNNKSLFLELKRQRRILKNWKLWASPSIVSSEQIKWIEKANITIWMFWDIAYWFEEAKEKILFYNNK